jgi:hypothetical protein
VVPAPRAFRFTSRSRGTLPAAFLSIVESNDCAGFQVCEIFGAYELGAPIKG